MKPVLSKLSFRNCAILGALLLLISIVLFIVVLLISVYHGSEKSLVSGPVVIGWTPSSSAMEDLEHAEKMRKFVEANGGCELPCWMGMRAGETRLEYILEEYASKLEATPFANNRINTVHSLK